MINTFIKTLHEEYFNKKSISILMNYYDDKDINSVINSFILYYYNETYIVFETLSDCIDFVLYGTDTIYRGYISEEDFDFLYDNGIEGYFKDNVMWVN